MKWFSNLFKSHNDCDCSDCQSVAKKIGRHLPKAVAALIIIFGFLELSIASILVGMAVWMIIDLLNAIVDKIDNGPWY